MIENVSDPKEQEVDALSPEWTPPEAPPAEESTETPPIVHEPAPSAEPAAVGKQVEVSRIPEPVLSGGRVIFPNAYGVDYTVDEQVVRGAQKMPSELKVVAVARPGFNFAKGLKRTFNLKG